MYSNFQSTNKQLIARGLFLQGNGSYIAKTFLEQRPFKGRSQAVRWLSNKGLCSQGRRILEVENVA